MHDFRGKWALVTGASRGVGQQIATGLAQLGCNVALHSRHESHTAALADTLRKKGVSVLTFAAELDDSSAVDAMLDKLLAAVPQLDVLYNNAAIMTPWQTDPWATPAGDFRRSFEVNFITAVRICSRLVPLMIARGWGRVINVSSGIADQPQLSAYAASKAALDKYVRDFAPSLAGSGVTMNLLDPGWLRTDLGGPNAPNDVSSVMPGALVPALLNDGVSGKMFRAQDFAGKSLEQALAEGGSA
jgi:3-oxoacyl-[acyl-carrier protein] reductase